MFDALGSLTTAPGLQRKGQTPSLTGLLFSRALPFSPASKPPNLSPGGKIGSCFLRPVNSCAFRMSLMMLSPIWFFHTCLLQSHTTRQVVAVWREGWKSCHGRNLPNVCAGCEGNLGSDANPACSVAGSGWLFLCSLIWFLSWCIGNQIRFWRDTGRDESGELCCVFPICLMLCRWESIAGFDCGGKRISAAIEYLGGQKLNVTLA